MIRVNNWETALRIAVSLYLDIINLLLEILRLWITDLAEYAKKIRRLPKICDYYYFRVDSGIGFSVDF